MKGNYGLAPSEPEGKQAQLPSILHARMYTHTQGVRTFFMNKEFTIHNTQIITALPIQYPCIYA